MILRPFRRSARARTIRALYGAIVAQARLPIFYTAFGVPDTVEGRFDLIVLHLVLLLHRLERDDAEAGGIGQDVFDAFCRDLDHNLREMGVGDLAVPKEMRRFAEAYYGRQSAYLAALGAGDTGGFEKALTRNIFPVTGVAGGPARLARYARTLLTELDAQDESALVRGEIVFPRPEAFADA